MPKFTFRPSALGPSLKKPASREAVCAALRDAIEDDIRLGRFGQVVDEDGSPVELNVYVDLDVPGVPSDRAVAAQHIIHKIADMETSEEQEADGASIHEIELESTTALDDLIQRCREIVKG